MATLPLIDLGRRARAAGFDDALFVDRRGVILEGTIWNLGLYDGESVTWPEAPMLVGVTMQLVQKGLEETGVSQRRQVIRKDELGRYRSGFVTYSHGRRLLIRSRSRTRRPDLPGL